MNYGQNLLRLREIKNLTQIEVAKILNIDHSQYSHYELEDRNIPIKHLLTLANYYNVSLDYIFGFTTKKNYKKSTAASNNITSGLRLKEFRKSLKLSQAELGKVLNCSYGTISGYEKGRYQIATPFLYDICTRYNISSDYLLGKIDSPKYLK